MADDEDEFENHSRLFRELFSRSHDAIVVFDPARDEIIDANDQACRLFGDDRETFLSRSP